MEHVVEDVEPYLRVGESVVLHFNPSKTWGGRFRSVVRGWHKSKLLILDRPQASGQIVPIHREETCLVRFLCDGTACGFESRVLDFDTRSPIAHFRLSWPGRVKIIAFRKHPRVAVTVPCEYHLGEKTGTGELRDVSQGGCGVWVAETIEPGAELSLAFTLPGGSPMDRVNAVVRNVRDCDGGGLLGCEFIADQSDVQAEVAFFTVTTLNRADEKGAEGRVLVIEPNEEAVRGLREAFKETGWQTLSVDNVADGLARIRMADYAMLLVGQQQTDLEFSDVVRLLRSAHAMERLPVFVYGAADDGLQKEASEAGVAGWLPFAPLNGKAIHDGVLAQYQRWKKGPLWTRRSTADSTA